MPEKLSYTVAQAAQATGLSRATIFNLFNQGKLTRLKVGARTLIGADDLRRFLTSCEARDEDQYERKLDEYLRSD